MPDLPTGMIRRGARVAMVPAAHAGRVAWGVGRRVGGQSAEVVAAEVQARTAEQLFQVLGNLKGGATKVGQALSVVEVGLPDELAGPYREALGRLQDSVPAMDGRTVEQLVQRSGIEGLTGLERRAVAAASIGQVHRGLWVDGQEVAVKVQYPGAARAVRSDLRVLELVAPLLKVLSPGLDARALLREVRSQVEDELDYQKEARAQEGFAQRWEKDPEVVVPHVLAATEKVLVTQWVESTPLLAPRSEDERDRLGEALLRFELSSPRRVGLLHADPHPGNFRVDGEGRLVVLDYGASVVMDAYPETFGRSFRHVLHDEGEELMALWQEAGMLRDDVDPDELLEYGSASAVPLEVPRFRFTREWVQSEAGPMLSPASVQARVGRKLDFPPHLLAPHRVLVGTVGMLAQLEAEVPYRALVEEHLPGFA